MYILAFDMNGVYCRLRLYAIDKLIIIISDNKFTYTIIVNAIMKECMNLKPMNAGEVESV